jgi:hypothetical protein
VVCDEGVGVVFVFWDDAERNVRVGVDLEGVLEVDAERLGEDRARTERR